MKILSIDLATKQVGFALLDDTHLKTTKTIKAICDKHIYQVGNFRALTVAYLNIKAIVDELKPDKLLFEWSIITTTPKYVSFCEAIMMSFYKDGYNVVPMNESKWLSVANKTFSIKRKEYVDGRDGNKSWLSDLANHYEPNWKFNSQDEKDAFIMGLTYLLNEKLF